ncbi:SDR family NAD(P)-dependent oxidoreductase [Shewanella sp. NIFS-20-20]|uniref:SDR family NAD(P)-dependent oxidoreductase n=1 Tax=Shewanella sp. NIFS-20-20 TaxID=2853806 RepID=UPI001C46759C|nr:SDR family NAD(P)-dependent oxidoreductase [Shewanella sp. NIFS-20-20]MBV7314509.1 SDR family NAD(P)-dependent oxidoreductase [Shewanella sp. NIFS-20-20]
MTAYIKQVLITGASSGIGAQLAKDYLALGYRVFACGRNAERLNAIPGVFGLVFDMDVREGVQSAGRYLAHELGGQPLDIIILNAGTCEYIDDAINFDDQLFARIIHTNLIATGYCLAAFLPLLAKGGRLGLMSSSATFLPLPRAEAYGASKAGISYLAASLGVDLAAANISVSCISPGFVATPLTDKNDFPMPMRISVDKAAGAIIRGLDKRQHQINFPRGFIVLMKLVSWLPYRWWVKLMGQQNNKSTKVPDIQGLKK